MTPGSFQSQNTFASLDPHLLDPHIHTCRTSPFIPEETVAGTLALGT